MSSESTKLWHANKKILELVPGTTVNAIERCSGHDGTYGVKLETHDIASKLLDL